jgi:hypothetical protein
MIIGMTRYSVAALFARDHPNKNFSVYEEPYFSNRLRMFRGVTLPSLAAQTNKDFILLVYHSYKMPDDKKEIFANLEKEFPFMRNVFISGAKLELPDDLKQQRILTFRIDNDDGVADNFIETLSSAYNRAGNFFDNVMITIPKIRKIGRISKNQFQTDESIFISHAIGQAYLSTNGETIMDLGNHRLVPYVRPAFCFDGSGGLQVIHGTNVANGFKKIYYKKSDLHILNSDEMQKLLESEGYKNINLSSIPILEKVY